MSASPRIGTRRRGRSRWTAAVGCTAAVAVALSLAAGTGIAAAGPRPSASPTPVTRAALDPALVQGRGARVDFTEQEAENAATTGTVIGPERSAYALPARRPAAGR